MLINSRPYRSVLLVLAVLLLAGLACNFPTQQASQPQEQIPVSTEAVQNLEEALATAAVTAQSGQPVTITMTEEQLTSLVALELQSQESPMLQEPQVFLRDGQITVTGKVQQSGLTAPLTLVLDVGVDPQGQLVYQVVSGSLGPFPIPETTLDDLTQQLNRVMSGYIGAETENVLVEDVQIANGSLTLTGRTR